jgi:predicted transcriptional regulator
VVNHLAKVTLSVPDELYEKLEKYKERLNYSDIFRRAVSEEMERIEEKGELIEGLENYLSGRLPTTEDKERVRKEEIVRFTKKWGPPDPYPYTLKTEHASPYIELRKWQEIKHGDRTIARLYICNDPVLAKRVIELDEKGWGKYSKDIQELYPKEIQDIAEYFKSRGFIVAEDELSQDLIILFVTGDNKQQARDLQDRGYHYFGLFATDQDKRDWVFIGYREVKPQ